ncbi:chromosome partitioning protein [Naumannella halotolerans]|uniref:Chromosome partitioning protein n=1 Tax=Naumannella halotolerans TaxID=993414 RepID=A0A4R7J3S6_9ACTN|nr:chromosome partitioning protein [Naumannella halotolerans]
MVASGRTVEPDAGIQVDASEEPATETQNRVEPSGSGDVPSGSVAVEIVEQAGSTEPAAPVNAPDSGTDELKKRVRGARRAAYDAPEEPEPDSPDDLEAPVSRETSLPRPAATRTMVVANQKGGVGKTTTAVNIATGLALGGLDVVVIDLDPQGNASTALGIEHHESIPGTYEVLLEGETIEAHLADSPEADSLKVLPATINLAGAEIQLVSAVARETRLRKAIRKYLETHSADYIILDCPPSLGLLTLNALVAADEIMIPIQCEYYALEGVSQLMNTINLVKGELNDDLLLSTVLLTMYDGRTRLSAQVADEVREHFPEQTLETAIPRSVRISEAPSYGQTVITYHVASAGAEAYLKAAAEVARRGAEEH